MGFFTFIYVAVQSMMIKASVAKVLTFQLSNFSYFRFCNRLKLCHTALSQLLRTRTV